MLARCDSSHSSTGLGRGGGTPAGTDLIAFGRQSTRPPPCARAARTGPRVGGALRSIERADLGALLERIGDSSVVLLGEATHGTSRVGDVSATEMGARGEHNVGMLCRREYGDDAFLVGFGTDRDTVAAASDWGGPMYVKNVRPSLSRSYEPVSTKPAPKVFFLHVSETRRDDLREELAAPLLERAIGVIYRPATMSRRPLSR